MNQFLPRATGAAVGLALTCAIVVTAQPPASQAGVQVVPKPAEQRVDVLVDGKPFTAYIWPGRLKKPVLYPLNTAGGAVVTRGFPLNPRPGERVDHPHQVGLWFNHGDVNGVDFWNNSEALKPEQAAKMGTIHHRRIVTATSGPKGVLEVATDWVMPDGSTVVNESARFVFAGGTGMRSVDRITTLTAASGKVLFKDNKEGVKAREGRNGTDLNHYRNFVECVRTRTEPTAPAIEGHWSSALSHYALTGARVNRVLEIDPATELAKNDVEANAMLTRKYRPPFVVPEKV
jgi:hypothetical protein